MAKGKRGKGFRLKWSGDVALAHAQEATVKAMMEIGLRIEGESKKELYKGHGVITGTLRRSIHTATPGYTWRDDDVKPAPGTPERGGQMALPTMKHNRIVVQVGSGLEYAIWVHQGHRSFEGYHFIRNGVDKVRPLVPGIVRKHAKARQ